MIRDTSPLARYLEIKAAITELESELTELKDQITSDLLDEHGERFEFDMGGSMVRFKLIRRTTWEYSDDIQQMERQLKYLKKEEEQTGVALPKKQSIYPTHEWI